MSSGLPLKDQKEEWQAARKALEERKKHEQLMKEREGLEELRQAATEEFGATLLGGRWTGMKKGSGKRVFVAAKNATANASEVLPLAMGSSQGMERTTGAEESGSTLLGRRWIEKKDSRRHGFMAAGNENVARTFTVKVREGLPLDIKRQEQQEYDIQELISGGKQKVMDRYSRHTSDTRENERSHRRSHHHRSRSRERERRHRSRSRSPHRRHRERSSRSERSYRHRSRSRSPRKRSSRKSPTPKGGYFRPFPNQEDRRRNPCDDVRDHRHRDTQDNREPERKPSIDHYSPRHYSPSRLSHDRNIHPPRNVPPIETEQAKKLSKTSSDTINLDANSAHLTAAIERKRMEVIAWRRGHAREELLGRKAGLDNRVSQGSQGVVPGSS